MCAQGCTDKWSIHANVTARKSPAINQTGAVGRQLTSNNQLSLTNDHKFTRPQIAGPDNQYLNSLLTAIPFGLSSSSNGSLSDSGISDGGASSSDYGLSERERRLSALRRLARQLESALAPGSAALNSIAQRMEAAEADLRSLQDTCRQLIVRTAASQMQQQQQQKEQKEHAEQNERRALQQLETASSDPVALVESDSADGKAAAAVAKKANKSKRSTPQR